MREHEIARPDDEALCRVAKVGVEGATVDLRAVYELGRNHGSVARMNAATEIVVRNVEYRIEEIRRFQKALRRRARQVKKLRAELAQRPGAPEPIRAVVP